MENAFTLLRSTLATSRLFPIALYRSICESICLRAIRLFHGPYLDFAPSTSCASSGDVVPWCDGRSHGAGHDPSYAPADLTAMSLWFAREYTYGCKSNNQGNRGCGRWERHRARSGGVKGCANWPSASFITWCLDKYIFAVVQYKILAVGTRGFVVCHDHISYLPQ